MNEITDPAMSGIIPITTTHKGKPAPTSHANQTHNFFVDCDVYSFTKNEDAAGPEYEVKVGGMLKNMSLSSLC